MPSLYDSLSLLGEPRAAFKEVEEKDPSLPYCVYLLLSDNDWVLYVGQSRQLRARIKYHRKHRDFDRAVTWPYRYATQEEAEIIEQELIRVLQPEWNKRKTGRGVRIDVVDGELVRE